MISLLALLPAPQRGDRILRPCAYNIYTKCMALQPFVLDVVIGVGCCRRVYRHYGSEQKTSLVDSEEPSEQLYHAALWGSISRATCSALLI